MAKKKSNTIDTIRKAGEFILDLSEVVAKNRDLFEGLYGDDDEGDEDSKDHKPEKSKTKKTKKRIDGRPSILRM